MTTSRAETLLGILQTHFTPREEGWLWLAMYDDGAPTGVVEQIEGAYEEPLEMARSLANIVNECSADLGYIALCRQEGRPTESDRTLWRELRGQAKPEKLVDLVVFNSDRAWSMRREDDDAARAAGA